MSRDEIIDNENDSNSIQNQLKLLNITEEDFVLAKKVSEIVNRHSEAIIEQFYERLLSIPHLKEIIVKHSSIERLRQTLNAHLKEMFITKIDNYYMEDRKIIALTHFVIQLKPKWYIGAFHYLCLIIQSYIQDDLKDYEEAARLNAVVIKLLSFEMQIVLEAYDSRMLSLKEIDGLLSDHEEI